MLCSTTKSKWIPIRVIGIVNFGNFEHFENIPVVRLLFCVDCFIEWMNMHCQISSIMMIVANRRTFILY